MPETHSGFRTRPPAHRPTPLDVSLRSEGASTWVVEVRGELDLATGPILKQYLEPYRAMNGNDHHRRRIVFLLSEVTFMDASGLGALLGAAESHDPHTISIREPSPRARRLLELVGLDTIIETPTHRR